MQVHRPRIASQPYLCCVEFISILLPNRLFGQKFKALEAQSNEQFDRTCYIVTPGSLSYTCIKIEFLMPLCWKCASQQYMIYLHEPLLLPFRGIVDNAIVNVGGFRDYAWHWCKP